MNPTQIPYGLHDGQLRHIQEVERGLACACVCPGCGGRLIARKGKKTAHHFAHHSGEACGNGLESGLHLAAKAAIVKAGYINLPAAKLNNESRWIFSEPVSIQLSLVELEVRRHSVIFDLLGTSKHRELGIEILVTHKVDEIKARRIAELNISTIEIDLSQISRFADRDEIMENVVNNVGNKHWIHNARIDPLHQRIRAYARRIPITQRGMALHADGCPEKARVFRGKIYANVIDDCFVCPFYYHAEGDDRNSHKVIYCLGDAQIDSVKAYLKSQTTRPDPDPHK